MSNSVIQFDVVAVRPTTVEDEYEVVGLNFETGTEEVLYVVLGMQDADHQARIMALEMSTEDCETEPATWERRLAMHARLLDLAQLFKTEVERNGLDTPRAMELEGERQEIESELLNVYGESF